jgi:ankyrin repeat protein
MPRHYLVVSYEAGRLSEEDFRASLNELVVDFAPVHIAARTGDLQMMESLVDKGALLDITDLYGGTALMLAASNGHRQVVSYLLGKGANVVFKDRNGKTALDQAGER